jgi:WD40 repeat protein
MFKQALFFSALTSSLGYGQATDIFPVRTVAQDRTQIAIEVDNESNFDVFCEYIVSPVVYRSAETTNNIEDLVYLRNAWFPKQTKRTVFAGLDVTQRLRNGLYSDAKIDVVKNEFISNYTKCSYSDLKFNTASFQAHDNDVIELEVSPDGFTMASSGRDNKVKLWSTVNGAKIRDYSFPSSAPNITFSSDGRFLVIIPSEDTSIYHYDVTTGLLARKQTVSAEKNSFSVFSPDGRFALVRAKDGLYLTSLVTDKSVWLTSSWGISSSNLLSFSADSKKIAFAHGRSAEIIGVMGIDNFPNLDAITSYYQQDENVSPVTHTLSWSNDSQKLLIGKNSSYPNPDLMTVLTFNGNSYSTSLTVNGDSGLFLPNGNVGLVERDPNNEGRVKVWVPSSPFAHVLFNSIGAVSAYSSLHSFNSSALEGLFLTSGSGWIRAFKNHNGEDAGSLYAGRAVYTLGLSNDGKYLYAGLGGGQIGVYDIKLQLLKQ